MSKRRMWISAILGLLLTGAPLLLIELTPQPGQSQRSMDKVLSVLTGPGVILSRPLLGVHNLGFFILTPLLNFGFWAAASYLATSMYARLHRSAP